MKQSNPLATKICNYFQSACNGPQRTANLWRMSKMKLSKAVSAYMAKVGSKGGKNGSRADKVKAARIRWAKINQKSC